MRIYHAERGQTLLLAYSWWTYRFDYEYACAVLCPISAAILLGRYDVARYGILLEEMLCKSGVIIDNTAVMQICY